VRDRAFASASAVDGLLGAGSESRRDARSGLGSLAGSVARPPAPAPRLLSVFRSAWLRQSKGKARQKPSLCEYP